MYGRLISPKRLNAIGMPKNKLLETDDNATKLPDLIFSSLMILATSSDRMNTAIIESTPMSTNCMVEPIISLGNIWKKFVKVNAGIEILIINRCINRFPSAFSQPV